MEMENLGNGIIQGNLLQKAGLSHGVSTKILGNMSFDRDQKNEAKEHTHNFLENLGLDISEISLVKLPTRNTTNVALISKPRQPGILVLKETDSSIAKLHKFDHYLGIDACISNAKNTFLAILPADCAAVMLFDPKTGFYALIHAGKAGVEAGIILKTLLCLQEWTKSIPQNLLCYIGPNICQGCYKIGANHFDLAKEIRYQLLKGGVREKCIEISQFCTHHHYKLFFSHYRSGGSQTEGRQIAIIGKR